MANSHPRPRRPAWWKILLTGVFWCAVMVIGSRYWRAALMESMHGPCVANPKQICFYSSWYGLAHPLNGDGAVGPDVSWQLAALAVMLTFLAFSLHIVRAQFEEARAETQRAGAVEQDDLEEDAIYDHDRRTWRDRARNWFWLFVGWFLPAGVLFGAMIQHGYKDAAAFSIALAAIYVAAEHYSSLERQRQLVNEQERALRRIKRGTGANLDAQQRASRRLRRVAAVQRGRLAKLNKALAEKVGGIENALGTQYGTQKIYEAYARKPPIGPEQPAAGGAPENRDIHAVYRFFTIDSEWWTARSWDAYRDLTQGTLHDALVKGERRNVLIVASLKWPSQTAFDDQTRGRQFGQLLGLMWHWTVLWYVQQKLQAANTKDLVNYSIRVARTQQWLHVVGNSVYQILGAQAEHLRVRNLTFDLKDSGAALAEWARKDIKDVAMRGPTAKEYICARLLEADKTLTVDGNRQVDGPTTTGLLDSLGIEQWLDTTPPPGVDETRARQRCSLLLRHFLAIASTGHAPSSDGNYAGTINSLAKEVE
ncbi:hypothetical protein P3T20_004071 [Paraburkholderia sp. GAS206C]|uniref:hypothetical protein n=1 Tax=unclassified Paraburkholderia TaxID=2615204 RepID=UPI003D1DB235